jgi:hypothetical protein
VRQPANQQKHDSIVSARAGELLGEGSRVWADVEGYPQPQPVFGYIPDIIANGTRNLISEVETSDSYSSDHTKQQLRAFDLATNYLLEVVVPKSVYEVAVAFCNAWGISVDCWRTFQG